MEGTGRDRKSREEGIGEEKGKDSPKEKRPGSANEYD